MQTSWIVGLIFIAVGLLCLIFWPGKGLWARLKILRLARQRQQIEDALKYIFNLQLENQAPTLDALAGALRISQRRVLNLVAQIQTDGLVEQGRNRLFLTPQGQRWALQVVRAHRLWERYLADEARVPLDQIHEMAHKLEHKSNQAQIDELDASLGYPSRDPHGDPIPNAAGDMRRASDSLVSTTPLTDWKAGERGRIVHLEDEPPVAYAQLVAEGLHIGQWITVLAQSNQSVTLTDGQREINIAPAIAANVFLQKPDGAEMELEDALPLSNLETNIPARIIKLDDRCQGFTRRRFLDLGLTPGTEIYPELENSFKEPRAYRVRGTLIALRNDQADMILVQTESTN